MAEKKSITLQKGTRKVTLTIPRDIVEYKAAGWREEAPKKPSRAAKADEPTSSEGSDANGNPRSAAEKGGAKK